MGILGRIFGKKAEAPTTRAALSISAGPRWTINIDGDLPSTEAVLPWVAYAGSKTQLRDGVHPRQKAGTLPARVSEFEEEYVARDDGAEFCQIQPPEKAIGDAYMRLMVEVRSASLMREYVWHFLRRPDWPEPAGLEMDRLAAWLKQKEIVDHAAETRATITRSQAE